MQLQALKLESRHTAPPDLCHLANLKSQIGDSSELGQRLITDGSSQTLEGIATTYRLICDDSSQTVLDQHTSTASPHLQPKAC